MTKRIGTLRATKVRLSALVAVIVGALACQDVPMPTTATTVGSTPLGIPNYDMLPAQILSPDDEDARFAREEVPGLAGTIIEADGTRVSLQSIPIFRPPAESYTRPIMRLA